MRIFPIRLAVAGLLGLNIPQAGVAATLIGSLPGDYSVMSVAADGSINTGAAQFSFADVDGSTRLYLVDAQGALAGPVVVAVKDGKKLYTLDKAIKKKVCGHSSATLLMGIDPGTAKKLDLKMIKVSTGMGVGYLTKLPARSRIDVEATADIADETNCLPQGTGQTLGYAPARVQGAGVPSEANIPLPGDVDKKLDADSDGLIDALDVDVDNDGVLNAYETSNSGPADDKSRFTVFSNLKLGMGQSLNQYVKTLTKADLDQAAGQIGLAMQVAGGPGETSELDCGGLSYCSTGGTGSASNKRFPDESDKDGNGLGEIERGNTGDFQLRPNVTANEQIGGGDVYLQVVTDATGATRKVPGMLNFVFRTTPAIRSMAFDGGVARLLDYSGGPGTLLGGQNNPEQAPTGWQGKLTLTAFRPQRPGFPGTGEGEFVDVGRSLITIDIPNGPCNAGGGSCVPQGPGNCPATMYTPTDSVLSADPNGLRDTRGDQTTDTANPDANTVSFTIDLDACLLARGITWTPGQSLGIDLQFRNNFGDNAAQKFYIQKN